MAMLALALVLVKRVRLSRWRQTLGALATVEEKASATFDVREQPAARAIAGSLARADWRLPLATKCLARAVALQWRLRIGGISSLLVVAVHVRERNSEDAFHAWVERDGEILVGQCDRSSYRPIMVFAQGVQLSSER